MKLSRDDVPQGQEGERRNGRLEISEKGGIQKVCQQTLFRAVGQSHKTRMEYWPPVGTRSSLGENAALPVVVDFGRQDVRTS